MKTTLLQNAIRASTRTQINPIFAALAFGTIYILIYAIYNSALLESTTTELLKSERSNLTYMNLMLLPLFFLYATGVLIFINLLYYHFSLLHLSLTTSLYENRLISKYIKSGSDLNDYATRLEIAKLFEEKNKKDDAQYLLEKEKEKQRLIEEKINFHKNEELKAQLINEIEMMKDRHLIEIKNLTDKCKELNS